MFEDAMLLKRPDFLSFVKFAGFSTFSGLVTHYLMNPRERAVVKDTNVIVTTGCDSGLGYSIALHCHEKLNMSVVACVHQLNSSGAIKLKKLFENSNRFHMVELEITEDESIDGVKKFVNQLLESNKELGMNEFSLAYFYEVKFILTCWINETQKLDSFRQCFEIIIEL